MESITRWIDGHQTLLEQLGIVSLLSLGVTLVALPIVVVNLPVDYFSADRRGRTRRRREHAALWAALALVKNLLGALLILAGIAMLVLPGQGTLTILIGLALTNFPGKYKIERRIVAQRAVGKALNRIRALYGTAPLNLPTQSERESAREP